ncbi:hypothetical protein [Glycomyces niveus]|jgi:hypothetical protein|uniref:Envelope stress response membrane protein PspB n=1 Tax=Glycomyces niveus TaxID=2820287 RepID=A0ABS3U7P7_9ACTN|nr:hypothetical protein [Glycomyces sp. NEAU-S30]MBO3734790.1 hypothetical protein [Glycomyces sp. NEAU-S30]
MIPSELFPIAASVFIATPIALVFRYWFTHRSTIAIERAKTERMRQALMNSTPAERGAILRALAALETSPADRPNDE